MITGRAAPANWEQEESTFRGTGWREKNVTKLKRMDLCSGILKSLAAWQGMKLSGSAGETFPFFWSCV